MIDRRYFLAYAGGTALTLFALGRFGHKRAVARALAGGTLDVRNLPKFVTPLPIPQAMPRSGRSAYTVAIRQVAQQILPPPLGATTVWAYGSTTDDGSFHSPAFTIEAERGEPVEITWINDLKDKSGAYLPHLLPVDPTLHWANPPGPIDTRPRPTATPAAYTGPVPIVTHVHGIEGGEDWSDGYPEAWYLPAASNIPAGYASHGTWYEFFRKKCGGAGWSPGQARYVYPNTQRPATLWLHDHALGVTRLNVYAGLVGFYLIRSADPADHPTVAGGKGPAVLPSGQYEIPLVIQDRSFNADGSLFYPDSRFFNDSYAGPYIPTCGVSPIWVPEFFGNCMMVNGKTWPYCSVEPRRYLLRILNGCNGRFLVLKFGDPRIELWQIGSDGGYLRAPAKLKQLLLSPAERADVIVDFSKARPGARVTLRNHGPDGPYPGDDEDEAADPRTTGQVMQFRVDQRLTAPDPTTHPAQLAMPNLAALQGGVERAIALLEASTLTADGKEIPVETTLGVVDAAIGLPKGVKPVAWHDPVSENPDAGATETWALYNFTEDAHPIHIHHAFFQVVDRQRFNKETGELKGKPRPPRPEEHGWKDTVIAMPGEVTRLRLKFAKDGQFVWHCHLLEHEDNEMMRPFRVGPPQAGAPA